MTIFVAFGMCAIIGFVIYGVLRVRRPRYASIRAEIAADNHRSLNGPSRLLR